MRPSSPDTGKIMEYGGRLLTTKSGAFEGSLSKEVIWSNNILKSPMRDYKKERGRKHYSTTKNLKTSSGSRLSQVKNTLPGIRYQNNRLLDGTPEPVTTRNNLSSMKAKPSKVSIPKGTRKDVRKRFEYNQKIKGKFSRSARLSGLGPRKQRNRRSY